MSKQVLVSHRAYGTEQVISSTIGVTGESSLHRHVSMSQAASNSNECDERKAQEYCSRQMEDDVYS